MKILCTKSLYFLTPLLLLPLVGCASSELAVRNVHIVEPGLLIRGGQPDEHGLIALQRTYGISTVVNLNDATTDSEKPLVEKLGMTYVPLPSNPFSPDPAKFLAFLRTVQDRASHAPVYVHCKDGMDRTGMAIATYRIVIENWSADRAMAELRSHQEFPHILLFLDIPFYVHDVAEHRQKWLDALRPSATPPSSTAPAIGSAKS